MFSMPALIDSIISGEMLGVTSVGAISCPTDALTDVGANLALLSISLEHSYRFL